MTNPFTLNFGSEPGEYVSRHFQSQEILDSFLAEPSPSQVYMITGVRGAGKTVFLTEIEDHFRNEDDWIVFDLSIETDLLNSFASKLYNEKGLRSLIIKANLNLSHFGFGVEISSKEPPITDLGTAIEEMLTIVAKHRRKVLISIDEAANSVSMRQFASEFQILLRRKFPVYLLMTGLYENIYDLQNVKTLTFLYRAPKIQLTPLNAVAVADSYKRIFSVSDEKSREMAALTMGYPYAYQVTGYLCYNRGSCELDDQFLHTFDEYMSEYVYSKIWDEQAPTKKKILRAMADTDSGIVTEIRQKVGMKTEAFSVYRSRLIRQGIIVADGYGRLAFTLPRFREFILNQIY
ncbi:MAG: ATP-binding protein [Lachnospiraceae bacterium]|nr:ATP-binding protein [Lachnospiraceae bacterium]